LVRGISIGPGDVAGYLGKLRVGFEALGVPCEHFLYIPPHKFSYAVPDYFLKSTFDFWMRMAARGGIWRHLARFADKAIRLVGFVHAIRRYDVFLFSGFGSFFRFFELPLLKLLGKRTIVVYLGSDARPPYLSGKYLDDNDGVFDPRAIAAETRAIRRQMARVERYATVIVNHTSTAQFSTRPFVRLSEIGLPMQVPSSALADEAAPRAEDAPVRILHAPSRPVAKGTYEVRDAVARMREEGIAVELVELTGIPNSEVLRQLPACDIVVDQLYSDVPLATFGAEAAAFGKPTVVGSLYVARFGDDNPNEMLAPTVFIDPEAFEAKIRRLVADEALRRAEGVRARAFLLASSTPDKVATRFMRLAEGDIPGNWIADPDSIDYIGGWGLSRTAWREQMEHYISVAGEAGLNLPDRPRLRCRILDAVAGAPIA